MEYWSDGCNCYLLIVNRYLPFEQPITLVAGPPASRCEARLPTPGTGGQALRAGTKRMLLKAL